MKLLTTEQQIELQEIVEQARGFINGNPQLRAQIDYWISELKPKRVRKMIQEEKEVK